MDAQHSQKLEFPFLTYLRQVNYLEPPHNFLVSPTIQGVVGLHMNDQQKKLGALFLTSLSTVCRCVAFCLFCANLLLMTILLLSNFVLYFFHITCKIARTGASCNATENISGKWKYFEPYGPSREQ
jgi:hypothetical protein